jgi:hypothetical protein
MLKKGALRIKKLGFVLIIIIGLISCDIEKSKQEQVEDVPIIPYPAKVLKRSGYITLDNNFWVITDVSDSVMARLGKYLVEELDQIPGAIGSIADLYSTRKHEQAISLELVNDPDMSDQGYRLAITSKKIQIEAVSGQGIFYGIQSILSLLESQWQAELRTATLRKMVITDEPKSKIRVIDLSQISSPLDPTLTSKLLARSKFNYLVVPENQPIGIDSSAMSKYYVELIRLAEQNDFSFVEPIEILRTDERKTIENLPENNESFFVRINQLSSSTFKAEIYLGGHLAWSGPGKKSAQWLLEHLQAVDEN